MDEPRKGCQTPTQSVVLPYYESYGEEAIELYQETGRTAQEWQQLLMNDILAVNDEGLWVHTKFGYSVPRRNGKNEIVAIRELQGLTKGEHILHTAHRTTTSHSAFLRLKKFLDDMGYTEVVRRKKDESYDKHYIATKQLGLEKIIMLSISSNGIPTYNFPVYNSISGLPEDVSNSLSVLVIIPLIFLPSISVRITFFSINFSISSYFMTASFYLDNPEQCEILL